MEFRIKPFPKNRYPRTGLLIKGSTPSVWLREMEFLGIALDKVKSFAIPSQEPNVLYGCFIIFHSETFAEVGKNIRFQCVENKMFIPENTIFYPEMNSEEWQHIDADFLIMHPDFGLVKLSEQIHWVSLLQDSVKSGSEVRKPLNGVKIPQKIESYMVEMDDEKVLEELQKRQTDEEWMKNLPFDMKKVLAGNQKEIEKYLKYIEKYPERAVDLGVPLDTLGTSRGDGFGKFKFGENSWWGKIFRKKDSNGKLVSGPRDYRWVLWVFWIVIIIGRLVWEFNKNDSPKDNITAESSGNAVSQQELKKNPPVLAFESGITEIDIKIDSLYGNKRKELINEYNATVSKNPNSKTLFEMAEAIQKFKTEESKTRDSLKVVYNKKIAKHIQDRSERILHKISDSLKKENPDRSVNEGIVKSVWKQKKILIEDSLGRLYGTIDPVKSDHKVPDSDSNIRVINNSENSSDTKISFSEIIWLVIMMIGSVGLYSYFFKRKTLSAGGSNVPKGIKIFLILILAAMLIYLFYPLIEMFGYNWFVWILILCVIPLLYRLFNDDKTILKSEDDE
ncbi:APC family permease [Chryseobacterium sp.]|uniref:APC family permease n=1 Tax=Chryseobacterium sp. TaxID=1871047 RepID=UPI0025C66151|nr:APC family permease [Chryseobacterium sp.]